MRVEELMTADVKTCRRDNSLRDAVELMFDNDCGCVPIVDENSKAVALLTDRDVCLSSYSDGRALAMADDSVLIVSPSQVIGPRLGRPRLQIQQAYSQITVEFKKS